MAKQANASQKTPKPSGGARGSRLNNFGRPRIASKAPIAFDALGLAGLRSAQLRSAQFRYALACAALGCARSACFAPASRFTREVAGLAKIALAKAKRQAAKPKRQRREGRA